MSGKLLAITPELFASCMAFLAPREARCITLVSNLVSEGEPCYPADHSGRAGRVKEFVCLYSPEENGTSNSIDGVIILTTSGILLHCLREDSDLSEYCAALTGFLSRLSIRCIIGSCTETRFLESLLPITAYRVVDYQLMTLVEPPNADRENIPDKISGQDTEIRKAIPTDAETILPLQEGYEKEEVIPPGDAFNRKSCLANLKHMLERQHINILAESGMPVAKAGTNARGLHWDQIGGVYTSPEWRSRGVASALVARTARELMATGRCVALFVKLSNIPARRAYEKTGFKPDIRFRITYY